MKKTRVCELLSIRYPIIQAPLVWISGAELVAAVSAAGGLGVLGPNAGATTSTSDPAETGERLRRQIKKVRSLTDKPFGVNINVSSTRAPALSDAGIRVILEEGVKVAALVGDEPERYARKLKDAGVTVLLRAQPVNVEAARKAEQAGVDILAAVGFEGGGHSGADRLPNSVLIPQIVDAVGIPVVAGGGISDGRGVVSALALGAEGVYLGTLFIATNECPAHQVFKQAIVNATDTATETWSTSTGVARALRSPVADQCVQMELSGKPARDRENLYRPGMRTGPMEGSWETGTFLCGAGAGLIREVKSAGAVVRDIVDEADGLLSRMSGMK
ncbi:MAG: nitronate monooxygenase [Chloroflexi bacterium]|nr:nitronate monooxygenase [Chloroflexota bacterium]